MAARGVSYTLELPSVGELGRTWVAIQCAVCDGMAKQIACPCQAGCSENGIGDRALVIDAQPAARLNANWRCRNDRSGDSNQCSSVSYGGSAPTSDASIPKMAFEAQPETTWLVESGHFRSARCAPAHTCASAHVCVGENGFCSEDAAPTPRYRFSRRRGVCRPRWILFPEL